MARRAGGGRCGCALALLLAASVMVLGGAAAFERDASPAAAGEARGRLADIAGTATAGTRRAGKVSGGGGAAALVFAEGLRQLLERHLLGVCDTQPAPGYSKYEGVRRGGGAGAAGNSSGAAAGGCAAEDPRELSARLAELALRASMLSRSRACDSLLSVSLAHALGDLARKSSRASPSAFRMTKAVSGGGGGAAGVGTGAAGTTAEKKPRKLSKSQKSKLQAKQKTALAVKKKAAAAAAAALLNNKLRSELPA